MGEAWGTFNKRIVALPGLRTRTSELQPYPDLGPDYSHARMDERVFQHVPLLQVGEQQILVGVGPGNVRTLHVFEEPAIEVAAQNTPSFAEVWKAATSKVAKQ